MLKILPCWQNMMPVPHLVCDKLSRTCKTLRLVKGACTGRESSVGLCRSSLTCWRKYIIWPLEVACASRRNFDTWYRTKRVPSADHLLSYLLLKWWCKADSFSFVTHYVTGEHDSFVRAFIWPLQIFQKGSAVLKGFHLLGWSGTPHYIYRAAQSPALASPTGM